MRARRFGACGVTLVLLVLAGSATAQEAALEDQPEAGTFFESVEVEVINVAVFVTDRKGQPVTGLGKEDFELFIDGESVPIAYFYAAAGGRPAAAAAGSEEDSAGLVPFDGPAAVQRLHIAVVVDNEHIRAANRKSVFRELREFLDTRLANGALVTVASLNPELVIHSDFLSDRRAVETMLDELERTSAQPQAYEMERRQILSELSPTGRVYDRRAYSEPGTLTPDSEYLPRIRALAESEFHRSQATLQTLARLVSTLAGVEGRKALLHVSDGIANRPGEELFLAWSYRYGDALPAPQGYRSAGVNADYFREIGRFDLLPEFRQLAELASGAGVTWYAIDAESDHAASLRTAALAGGVASEALDALETNVREPAELTADLTGGRRLQASTGLASDLVGIGDFDHYYSLGFTPPSDSEEGSHSIRVKVRGKGLVVRHRDSYRHKSSDERMAEATVAALLYHVAENPLGAALTPGSPQERGEGAYILPVELEIPLRNVVLAPAGNRAYTTQLSLYVTVKNRRGESRPVQKLPLHTNIPADRLEEARHRSLRYTLPVVVQAGDQQVAVGIRDEIGAIESCIRLQIPRLPSDTGAQRPPEPQPDHSWSRGSTPMPPQGVESSRTASSGMVMRASSKGWEKDQFLISHEP